MTPSDIVTASSCPRPPMATDAPVAPVAPAAGEHGHHGA